MSRPFWPGALLLPACTTIFFAGYVDRAALADTFVLASGASLDGELLNADESPRVKFVVRTAPGATVTFAKDQVRDFIRRNAAEVEYESMRHRHPDSVAGHWTIAEWCKENKLPELRKQHLDRILELDANHKEARSVLGYNKINGQWRTREQHMNELGKVQHKGEWMYPQEIEILEAREKANRKRAEWTADLKRWREWLGGAKDQTARTNLADISDPAALPAIHQSLDDEKRDEVRVMLLRALGKIGTAEALMSLAAGSLQDPSAEGRAVCADLVLEANQPALTSYYIQQLRNKDNKILNRAAYILGRIKDPRAIGPLIDALVTSHKFAVTSGAGPGAISASNGSFGGGLSTGSSTRIIEQKAQNTDVLNALVILCGGATNYQFNVDAWKQWHAGRKKNSFADARRD